VLRPGYFASELGSAWLDTQGPEARVPTTKEKRLRAPPPAVQSAEAYLEEEEGAEGEPEVPLGSGQQGGAAPLLGRGATPDLFATAGSLGGGGGALSPTRSHNSLAPGTSMGFPPRFPARRAPTTAYHRKDLRPAHFDVMNRPRAQPQPALDRHDAEGMPNDHFEEVEMPPPPPLPSPCTNWTRLVLPPVLIGHVASFLLPQVEMPVRRRTHTSSVVLKARRDLARGLLGVAPDGTVMERIGHSWRLRPRVARFGPVPVGKNLRFRMVLSNVGVETGRFRVRKPAHADVSVVYAPGPLAPGMSAALEVEILGGGGGRPRWGISGPPPPPPPVLTGHVSSFSPY